MDAVNCQRTVDQVFGELRDKKAIAADVRFSRGGLPYDQLAVLFTGGAAAVWRITVLGKIKYGIPQLGAKDLKTGWFEHRETIPDALVYNDPEAIAQGQDPQLAAAVAELLKPPRGQ